MASDVRGMDALAVRAPVSVATTLFPGPGPGKAVVRARTGPMLRGDILTRHLPGWLRHPA